RHPASQCSGKKRNRNPRTGNKTSPAQPHATRASIGPTSHRAKARRDRTLAQVLVKCREWSNWPARRPNRAHQPFFRRTPSMNWHRAGLFCVSLAVVFAPKPCRAAADDKPAVPKEIRDLVGTYVGAWTVYGIDAQSTVVKRFAWSDTLKV